MSNDTQTMTLTEFLLTRIAEAEVAADCYPDPPLPRVLAECHAKRRIVEDFEALLADYRVTHDPQTEARRFQAAVSMSHLAAVYADHPDYNEEWRA